MEEAVRPEGPAQTCAVPMVKFVLDISKKILPTASIFIRLLVPETGGTVIISVPSLGVALAKTVGKVVPPSVDNKMFTVAQFTDPAFVPFTLQVTVVWLPALQVTLVFGVVTWKGPAVLVTVTTISVKAVWPTAIGAEELKT